MWILYAFGSAFFAGITAILAKCGIRRSDSDAATAVRTVIVLLFSWLMVLINGSGGKITSLGGKTWVFLILSGLATGASWLCCFKALKTGDVNRVVPIDKSSTVLTVLFSFVFLGEKITPAKCAAVALLAIGTFLMLEKKQEDTAKPQGKGWLFYAVLSAVFAALTSILGKVGITGTPSELGTAIRTCVVLVMAWAVLFITGKRHTVREIPKNELGFICLSGLATGASWLCYYTALRDGPAAAVAPIDKLSIAVSVVFSYVVFGEKLSAKAFFGLLIFILGTMLMLL